jgi:hypothetical protein
MFRNLFIQKGGFFMNLFLQQNERDEDMVEMYTGPTEPIWLCAVAHIDYFRNASFQERLAKGEEIAVRLMEVRDGQ